jgi:DNA-binding NtrC family response regulator
MMMYIPELLIADEDITSRKCMADLFTNAGYQVTVPDSAAGVLYRILKKTARVILLSTRFDEVMATELIPILKRCNRNLHIILVASELPLTLIRKARSEGIFYHALKPTRPGDEKELQEVVKCAFENVVYKPAV